MSYFKLNLKTLRKHKSLSQSALSDELLLTRSTLSAYENGSAEPNFKTLMRISDFFKVNIDRLLRQDMSQLTDLELKKIEEGYDVDLRGKHLRILATTVDHENNEQIELVPTEAKAGYTAGYSDPEFISDLPRLSLPFLDQNRKHRVFPISGDSMPPIPHGSLVIGEYLDDWSQLNKKQPYIVVTREDGIVLKNIVDRVAKDGVLELHSTNPEYESYEVHIRDVLEIWRFIHYISKDIPDYNLNNAELSKQVSLLQRDVRKLMDKEK